MSATIKSAMAEGAATLAAGGVEESRRDTTLLLMHVLKRERAFLIAHPEEILTGDQSEQFRSSISRRAAGEPLQYITGHQEFFKLDFEVTPDVLIPRPETELIVEVGLEVLKNEPEPYVADIGTGSGCIAISLLHELPRARARRDGSFTSGFGVSAEKCGAASGNRSPATDRVGSVFRNWSAEPFHAIVSNPPYVPEKDMAGLQREVTHEPRSALEGGPDGLSIIRRLLDEAPQFLRRGGYFVFEIGFDQSEAIEQAIDDDSVAPG